MIYNRGYRRRTPYDEAIMGKKKSKGKAMAYQAKKKAMDDEKQTNLFEKLGSKRRFDILGQTRSGQANKMSKAKKQRDGRLRSDAYEKVCVEDSVSVPPKIDEFYKFVYHILVLKLKILTVERTRRRECNQ